MSNTSPLPNNLSVAIDLTADFVLQRSIDKIFPTGTLVVFDDRVSELAMLDRALSPGSIGFTIHANADGLETITQLLAITGAKYLAIVAHGEPGVVHLGKTTLNMQQLQAQAQLLQQWDVAEIALYSCEVAQSDLGQDFIYQLSELTGATVAAAATKIGNSALGGSWDLAITTGGIAAPAVFDPSILQTYPAVLATVEQVIKSIDLTGVAVSPFTGVSGTLELAIDSSALVGETDLDFTKIPGIPTLDYTLTPLLGITKTIGTRFTIAPGATQVKIGVDIKPSIFSTPGINFTTAFASIVGDAAAATSDAAIVYNPNNGKLFFNPDGTTAGFGSGGNFAIFSIQPTPKPTVRNDFNGDRKSDILWRSDIGGVALWQMNGATVAAANLTSTPSLDTSWKTAGTGDFNGDGKTDILWRNTNGAIAVWAMDGATVKSSTLTSTPSLDTSWKTAGTGDYNGDGKSDILWRNTNGAIAVWAMDGATVTSSTLTSTPSLDSSWKVAGNSDFNGDGKADILWRNDDGSVALWQMNGADITASTTVAKLSADWKIAGTGDFNGDNKADILWRNDDGRVVLWQMNGAAITSSSLTSTPSRDSSQTIAGIGDYNGDGKADILWRKDTGATEVWQMNGANVVASTLTSLQPESTAWKIAAPLL
jgi:Domain of unknown function (DUF4347)/FG-GAP-like repeat